MKYKSIRYGIIIYDDICLQNIGLVVKIVSVEGEKEVKEYYRLGKNEEEKEESYDYIRKDCVKLISKEVYDMLAPRNILMKKYIEDFDK